MTIWDDLSSSLLFTSAQGGCLFSQIPFQLLQVCWSTQALLWSSMVQPAPALIFHHSILPQTTVILLISIHIDLVFLNASSNSIWQKMRSFETVVHLLNYSEINMFCVNKDTRGNKVRKMWRMSSIIIKKKCTVIFMTKNHFKLW